MWDRIDRGLYWDEGINLVLGCTPVSPACDRCWAAMYAHRMARHPNPKISATFQGLTDSRGKWVGGARPNEKAILRLIQGKGLVKAVWTDLFHFDIPDGFIRWALDAMASAPQHVYLVLTKRAGRMRAIINNLDRPLPRHVWLGVTVEDQARAEQRIMDLAETHAPVKWISYEPALGPVPFQIWLGIAGIHWLIAGGETGPGARPVHPDWIRSARDAAQFHRVPFFFKQWGAYHPWAGNDRGYAGGWIGDRFVGKADIPAGEYPNGPDVCMYASGNGLYRELDGQVWNQHPEM